MPKKHPLSLTSHPHWKNLPPDQQRFIREHTQALLQPEVSELATGWRLAACRTFLEPQGMFLAWLTTLPWPVRTSYRRMDAYTAAGKIWPGAIAMAATERPFHVFGASPEHPLGLYEEKTKEFPPLKTGDKKVIKEYLDRLDVMVRLEAARRGRWSAVKEDPQTVLKEIFRFLEPRTPSDDVTREEFLTRVIGIFMSLAGIKKARSFTPLPIPPDFWNQGQGRFQRSAESREKASKSATARWQRIRAAKASAA